MKVVITGATGLVGSALVPALVERGDEVVVLSRDPQRASAQLGVPGLGPPDRIEALRGSDAVVNLAGEPIAQRWNDEIKEKIRTSRVNRTEGLVADIAGLDVSERPRALISASAAGYYGDRADEELTEDASPGDDFLATLCVDWEAAAMQAGEHGVRVVLIRTGIVLSRRGGALKQMLLPFKLGVGGRVGSGRQYMPWVALDDIVGLYAASISGVGWSGPVNASGPAPATNTEFTRELGRALRRPTIMPVPTVALRILYGEMSAAVLTGQRMVPARAQSLGYEFRHGTLPEALRAAL